MSNQAKVWLGIGLSIITLVVVLVAVTVDGDPKVAVSPITVEVAQPAAPVQPTPTVAPLALAELPPEPELGSGVLGGVEDFDVTDMEWQGYWYSRYNLLTLVVGSGMGITFQPPMERIQAAMQMLAQNPADPPKPPDNAAPLRAVYASGNASLLQDITKLNPNDISMFRFDPANVDKTVTASSLALSAIKEIEWVRNFSFRDHFGAPTDDFGATERFRAVVLSGISSQHGDFAIKEMKRDDGLYYNSDGTLDMLGNWWMLLAFADKAAVTGDATMIGANPETSALFGKMAQELHVALRSREVTDTRELSAAIQSLVWYAASTPSKEARDMVIEDILRYGEVLLSADTTTPTLKAAALRELIEVSRLTTNTKYIDRAIQLLDELVLDFDFDSGYFRSQKSYSVDDIAFIVGGLNAGRFHGGSDDTYEKSERMLLAFWESAIDMSGLVLSAPPGKANGFSRPYEQDLRELSYRYPTTPPPPAAGGAFGKAPVFATEVAMGSSWTVTNDRFDAAGAMHLSNEALWMHPDLGVNGFPDMPQDEPTAALPAQVPINITAGLLDSGGRGPFAFGPADFNFKVGETVTFTFNSEAVFHTFTVDDLGINVPVDGGETATFTFTFDNPGTFQLICIPHQALGMVGTITVQ